MTELRGGLLVAPMCAVCFRASAQCACGARDPAGSRHFLAHV